MGVTEEQADALGEVLEMLAQKAQADFELARLKEELAETQRQRDSYARVLLLVFPTNIWPESTHE